MTNLKPATPPVGINGQIREESELQKSPSGGFKNIDGHQKYYERTGKSVLTSSSTMSGSVRINGPQVQPKETLKEKV